MYLCMSRYPKLRTDGHRASAGNGNMDFVIARHYREKNPGTLPPPNLRGGTLIYLHLRREDDLNNSEPHGYNDESVHE